MEHSECTEPTTRALSESEEPPAHPLAGNPRFRPMRPEDREDATIVTFVQPRPPA
jgi:hypothetical protein